MKGYKVFTHDLRSPIQGGEPVWAGSLPHDLPVTALNKSTDECGAGWNACRSLEDALRIGGFWRGRPTRAFEVTLLGDVIERGNKIRTDRMRVDSEVEPSRINAAIRKICEQWFAADAEVMAVEQIAWREALGRPCSDPSAVERELQTALAARSLPWKLRRFDSAWEAWAARDAREAWAAWEAWAPREAWAAWEAWAPREAWAAWEAWEAWAARDARDAWAAWEAWAPRAARAAWAAWAALTVFYAAKKGWTKHDPMLLTAGIRNAYTHGLEVAVPTGPNELGWAMSEPTNRKD